MPNGAELTTDSPRCRTGVGGLQDRLTKFQSSNTNSKVTSHKTEVTGVLSRPADKVLLSRQKQKKSKYLQVCQDQNIHFSPFAVSTSGQLAPQASALLKRLAFLLHVKWDRPKSVITNFIFTQVSFAIVRACTICVYGMRTNRWFGHLFEDGAGLPDKITSDAH